MVAKIIRAPSFVEPCFYAMRGELKRPEVLAANGVRTTSAGEMAADFELQRSARPGLRQAVEHIALAWPPGEKDMLTDNEVMVRAAMLYLEKRGIDPATTQWALVRHHDQEHPHCHLILNRVTDDGQVLPDKNSHSVSAAACRKVEAAMGFVDAAKLGAAKKLQQAMEGELPTDVAERVQCKELIKRALEKHLPTATTVRELREALATEGVRMTPTLQGGQLQAVVFETTAFPGLNMKGSEVAREYSGVGLRKTLEAQAEHREATKALTEPRPQAEHLEKPGTEPDATPRHSDTPKRVIPQVVDLEEAKTNGEVFVKQPLVTAPEGLLSAEPRTQEAGQVATPPAEPSMPVDQPAPTKALPAVAETEEAATARYQTSVFRDAAAPVGEWWDSKEEATEIVQQLLRKALNTSTTEAGQILHDVKAQGFSFDKTYTMLRHNETGFKCEARLLSHGPRGIIFLEEALDVAAENKRTQLRESTRTILTALTERQPPMWSMDRKDFVQELAELKLTATWPGAVKGVGGTLTIEPTGTGVAFRAEELPLLNGQPLVPRLQELLAANWATKERWIMVYCADERRAGQVQQTLPPGVHTRPLEPAVAGAFAISYQLNSPAIDRIAAGFDASLYSQPGVRVLESVTAMGQRSDAAENRTAARNKGISLPTSRDKGRE